MHTTYRAVAQAYYHRLLSFACSSASVRGLSICYSCILVLSERLSRFMLESMRLDELEDLFEVHRSAISSLQGSYLHTDLECRRLLHVAALQNLVGNVEFAVATATRACDLRLTQRPADPCILAWTYNDLGVYHMSNNQFQEALQCFDVCLAQWRTSDSDSPQPTAMKANHARCLIGLSYSKRAKKLLDETIQEHRVSYPWNWADLAL
jgi:hypothetical protein